MSSRNKISSTSMILGVLAGGVLIWFSAPVAGWGFALGLFVAGLAAGWGCHAFLTAPPPIRTLVHDSPEKQRGRGRSENRTGNRDKSTVRRSDSEKSGRTRKKAGGRTEASKTSKVSRSKRVEGEVKWFDDTKGWGFIVPDGGGEECFVHRTAVEGGRRLKEGDRVEFHIEKDERGRIAAGEVKKV